MTEKLSTDQPKKLSQRAAMREATRANALRENLRKRKTQAQQQTLNLSNTQTVRE
jgi:hypothetical protein